MSVVLQGEERGRSLPTMAGLVTRMQETTAEPPSWPQALSVTFALCACVLFLCKLCNQPGTSFVCAQFAIDTGCIRRVVRRVGVCCRCGTLVCATLQETDALRVVALEAWLSEGGLRSSRDECSRRSFLLAVERD